MWDPRPASQCESNNQICLITTVKMWEPGPGDHSLQLPPDYRTSDRMTSAQTINITIKQSTSTKILTAHSGWGGGQSVSDVTVKLNFSGKNWISKVTVLLQRLHKLFSIPFPNNIENISCFFHVFVTHSLSLSCWCLNHSSTVSHSTEWCTVSRFTIMCSKGYVFLTTALIELDFFNNKQLIKEAWIM